MSQTSYGNWRELSNGRKALVDFASNIEHDPLKKPMTTTLPNSRGNSMTTILKDNSADNSHYASVIISNKKSKKRIKLRPLLPPASMS